jgi:hypothetical protein
MVVVRDQMLKPAVWARVLGLATIVGIEFALIGPFGSYPANVLHRMSFWIPLVWIGSLIVWPGLVAALTIGTRRGFPTLFSAAVGLLVASVPVAAIAATGCWLIWPVHASGMAALEYYGLTVLVAVPAAAAVLALMRLGGASAASSSSAAAVASAAPPAGDVLPDHLIETAICLQMEDHHVRIHLLGRSLLHLAPMGQAVAAIGERRGIQVHRSWWVADAAVKEVVSEGRAVSLVLVNGLKVPVARNRLAAVRARGLIGA